MNINECVTNLHNCHAKAAGINTDGSFGCICNSGDSDNGVSCTSKKLVEVS